jgi:hypothetical protein
MPLVGLDALQSPPLTATNLYCGIFILHTVDEFRSSFSGGKGEIPSKRSDSDIRFGPVGISGISGSSRMRTIVAPKHAYLMFHTIMKYELARRDCRLGAMATSSHRSFAVRHQLRETSYFDAQWKTRYRAMQGLAPHNSHHVASSKRGGGSIGKWHNELSKLRLVYCTRCLSSLHSVHFLMLLLYSQLVRHDTTNAIF